MALPSVYVYPASHYVVILTKAANQQRLPPLDLCFFVLDMKSGILVHAISHASVEPEIMFISSRTRNYVYLIMINSSPTTGKCIP